MTTRLYGLFEKRGTRWVRLCPTIALPKPQAIKVFQSHLLAPFMGAICYAERSLRPLPTKQV